MTQSVISLVCLLTAQYAHLDPYRVAAIIEVESHFNTKATGALGEQGLLQLRPEYFGKKGVDLYNPIDNLLQGLPTLARYAKDCPVKAQGAWVLCHNRGITGASRLKDPYGDKYYKRVDAAYRRITKKDAKAMQPSCAWRTLAGESFTVAGF